MFKPVSAKEERLLPVYVYGSESLEHQAQISRGKGFMLHSQISVCYSGEGVFTDHNNVSHKVQSGDIMYFTSASALAEMIKVTPTYLGIIFKKVDNITPQKFLTNIRIENSKQLLVSNKNMSLSDVAINSGFNSESYFCNTFKKYIGITPTEYRSINTFGEI